MAINKQRERRIMIIMRLSMFVIGATLGAIGMWQTLQAMAAEFHIGFVMLFYFAASLITGGVLFLSAPIARLIFHKISKYFRRKFKAVKTIDVAGVSGGLVVGVVVALLVEFIFVWFLPILAVRILIAILLGLTVAFIAAIAISGWIAQGVERERKENEEDAAYRPKGYKGFLLTEGALSHDKILNVCKLWLEGNIFVLAQTTDRLKAAPQAAPAEQTAENKVQEQTEQAVLLKNAQANAYDNYKRLYSAKSVKVLELLKHEDEDEAILDAAELKKLKIVCTHFDTEILTADREVIFLNLDKL